ncbi:MAG: SRPBCC family protein [Anaerolineales bacterium]|uniref:SRPBCC family protein n=1 Tax=Candidatus Villigracilis vicinus TaxID=3140679 RepID=UPI0031365600|nr:SRPBCC family protein [Anaerolineales bacterium]
MTKFSTSISIHTSQEAVWKVLSNVAHWHEWTPTVNKVEVLNTPELKLGNRYKVFQPKLQPVVWTVTELNSANFTWESKSPGMHMVAEHIVKSVNANQSEVTLTFAFNGWLGNLISKMYGKMTEEYVQTKAQSLKKKVETS